MTQSSLWLPWYSLSFVISEVNRYIPCIHQISGLGHRKPLRIHRHAPCSNHRKKIYTKLPFIFRPHRTPTNMYSQYTCTFIFSHRRPPSQRISENRMQQPIDHKKVTGKVISYLISSNHSNMLPPLIGARKQQLRGRAQ